MNGSKDAVKNINKSQCHIKGMNENNPNTSINRNGVDFPFLFFIFLGSKHDLNIISNFKPSIFVLKNKEK